MIYGKEDIQENLQMEVLVSLAKDGNWKSQKKHRRKDIEPRKIESRNESPGCS